MDGYAGFGTSSIEESEEVARFYAAGVAGFGGVAGHGYAQLAVVGQLFWNDAVGAAGELASEALLEDVVGGVLDAVGQIVGLGRAELFVSPGGSTLFGEREKVLGHGFVVSEGGVFYGEELAPLAGGLHVLDESCTGGVVIFFAILLVENAEFFALEPHAAKEVLGAVGEVAVEGVCATPNKSAEGVVVTVDAAHHFVEAFGFVADVVTAVAVFGGAVEKEAVLRVFRWTVNGETILDVFGVHNVFTGGVFTAHNVGGTVRLCEAEGLEFLAHFLHAGPCV